MKNVAFKIVKHTTVRVFMETWVPSLSDNDNVTSIAEEAVSSYSKGRDRALYSEPLGVAVTVHPVGGYTINFHVVRMSPEEQGAE